MRLSRSTLSVSAQELKSSDAIEKPQKNRTNAEQEKPPNQALRTSAQQRTFAMSRTGEAKALRRSRTQNLIATISGKTYYKSYIASCI